jgi:nucleoid-associated protein YgaU
MAERTRNIEVFKTRAGRRYYANVMYPNIPVTEEDTYLITTGGDRYDTLALQFYGDASLWWIIASANNSKKDGLNVKPGVQLRVPYDAANAIRLFDELNKNR